MYSGVKQVRIHYLLEMVWWDGPGKWVTNDLLTFLDKLIGFDLQPGFEVMGNPGNMISDFEDRNNLTTWFEMIQQVTGEMQGNLFYTFINTRNYNILYSQRSF